MKFSQNRLNILGNILFQNTIPKFWPWTRNFNKNFHGFVKKLNNNKRRGWLLALIEILLSNIVRPRFSAAMVTNNWCPSKAVPLQKSLNPFLSWAFSISAITVKPAKGNSWSPLRRAMLARDLNFPFGTKGWSNSVLTPKSLMKYFPYKFL